MVNQGRYKKGNGNRTLQKQRHHSEASCLSTLPLPLLLPPWRHVGVPPLPSELSPLPLMRAVVREG